ncbi:hypothetical protein Tco_0455589 [Tanacetum coccineum]
MRSDASHFLDIYSMKLKKSGEDENLPWILKEENKLEAEMIRIIESRNAASLLKPNTEEAVMVGGHAMYVRYIADLVSNIHMWESEGYIIFYDDKTKSYKSEDIYGNFEQNLNIKG